MKTNIKIYLGISFLYCVITISLKILSIFDIIKISNTHWLISIGLGALVIALITFIVLILNGLKKFQIVKTKIQIVIIYNLVWVIIGLILAGTFGIINAVSTSMAIKVRILEVINYTVLTFATIQLGFNVFLITIIKRLNILSPKETSPLNKPKLIDAADDKHHN